MLLVVIGMLLITAAALLVVLVRHASDGAPVHDSDLISESRAQPAGETCLEYRRQRGTPHSTVAATGGSLTLSPRSWSPTSSCCTAPRASTWRDSRRVCCGR